MVKISWHKVRGRKRKQCNASWRGVKTQPLTGCAAAYRALAAGTQRVTCRVSSVCDYFSMIFYILYIILQSYVKFHTVCCSTHVQDNHHMDMYGISCHSRSIHTQEAITPSKVAEKGGSLLNAEQPVHQAVEKEQRDRCIQPCSIL